VTDLCRCGSDLPHNTDLEGDTMTDLTDFICVECREANRTHDTHPGQMHLPGICDCPCRDQ